MSETSRYRIDAVYNAGRIIEIISNAREPMGPSELAPKVGVSPNTAFRMCETLDELRILQRVGDKYTLGMALAHCWARYKSRREGERDRIDQELKNLEIQGGNDGK
ncbi:MAG: helix-turn-helix domain-containing protein [Nitrospiraceae bacterium]|nr:helix-turn-helix domain-containing protein [Nitrospiraceae bacterium]